MRTNEVEKEDKSRESGIGGVEGVEAALDLVPSLELAVKRFNEIIRNVIIERLDANVISIGEKTLNRDIVSRIAVADNAVGITKPFLA